MRKWPGSFGEPRRRGLGGAQADPERLCAGREAMASGSNWLSGVNVVLVMAYGSLVRRPRVPALRPQLLAHPPAPALGWDSYLPPERLGGRAPCPSPLAPGRAPKRP